MSTFVWTGASSTTWGTAGNWSPSGPPSTSGDSAVFDWNATKSVAGADISATTLASLTIASTFGSAYSFGDLATSLKIGATIVRIGDPSGSATPGTFPGRINLDLGSVQSTVTIVATSAISVDTGLEPVRIKGTHASNKLVVQSGRVGVATNAQGDAATFLSISALGAGAVVNVASGVTLTTWRQEAGTGTIRCAATTLQQDGGILSTFGSGAVTTANISGQATLCSSGTITTLNIYSGGTVDMLQDSIPKTVTTVYLYKGSTFKFDPAVVTITNPINLVGCSLNDVTITTPNGLTVAVVKT